MKILPLKSRNFLSKSLHLLLKSHHFLLKNSKKYKVSIKNDGFVTATTTGFFFLEEATVLRIVI